MDYLQILTRHCRAACAGLSFNSEPVVSSDRLKSRQQDTGSRKKAGTSLTGVRPLTSASRGAPRSVADAVGRQPYLGSTASGEIPSIERSGSGFEFMEIRIDDLPEERMNFDKHGVKVNNRVRREFEKRALHEQTEFQSKSVPHDPYSESACPSGAAEFYFRHFPR